MLEEISGFELYGEELINHVPFTTQYMSGKGGHTLADRCRKGEQLCSVSYAKCPALSRCIMWVIIILHCTWSEIISRIAFPTAF